RTPLSPANLKHDCAPLSPTEFAHSLEKSRNPLPLAARGARAAGGETDRRRVGQPPHPPRPRAARGRLSPVTTATQLRTRAAWRAGGGDRRLAGAPRAGGARHGSGQAAAPRSVMKSRRLRLDTELSLPPAIPTLVWKVPANDGPSGQFTSGLACREMPGRSLRQTWIVLYPRRRASRSDDDIQRWRRALCGLLFDLEAELIDQCAPLAFLALDVGGVLLRRAGHRPTAVGDQAHFHVVGVDDLAQLPVEALDNRWRRAGRREQSVIEHNVEP